MRGSKLLGQMTVLSGQRLTVARSSDFRTLLQGVADGLADAGWVGTLWEESKMPRQNITYYTPFVSDDVALLAEVIDGYHPEFPALS